MRATALISMLPLTGCFGVQGSGIPDSVELELTGAITELVSANVVDVEISVGSPTEGTLTCDDNLLPEIIVEHANDTLTIRNAPSLWLNPRTDCRLDLQVPALEVLQVMASGDVTSDDALPTLREIRSGASGDIELAAAGAPDLDIRTGASGDVDIREILSSGVLTLVSAASGNQTLSQINVDTVDARLAASGDVRLDGTADQLLANLRASGSLEAFDLVVREAEVRIAGSGNAEIHATEQVTATLTASGDLRVDGSASISADVNGSGEVEQR